MDLTGKDGEIDVLVGEHAREALADALHLDEWRLAPQLLFHRLLAYLPGWDFAAALTHSLFGLSGSLPHDALHIPIHRQKLGIGQTLALRHDELPRVGVDRAAEDICRARPNRHVLLLHKCPGFGLDQR